MTSVNGAILRQSRGKLNSGGSLKGGLTEDNPSLMGRHGHTGIATSKFHSLFVTNVAVNATGATNRANIHGSNDKAVLRQRNLIDDMREVLHRIPAQSCNPENPIKPGVSDHLRFG